jgi:hypothetical protein
MGGHARGALLAAFLLAGLSCSENRGGADATGGGDLGDGRAWPGDAPADLAGDALRDAAPSEGPAGDARVNRSVTFEVTAPLTYSGHKPYLPASKVRLVLRLKINGARVTGYAGAVRDSPPTTLKIPQATTAVSGTVSGGGVIPLTVSLKRFQLDVAEFLGPPCYALLWLDVKSLTAAVDLAKGTLSGSLGGAAFHQEADVITGHTIAASLTGALDRTPPKLLLSWRSALVGPRHVLDRPSISFSEPVRLPAGSGTLARLVSGGKTLLTVPFSPGSDPAGATVLASPQLQFHLPFGASVAVAADTGLVDLAGNKLASPASLSVKTVADPGLLNNPGFERGDLGGYLVLSRASSCVSVVKALGTLKPVEGSYMAYISSDCLGTAVDEGHITARLKLPAGARTLTLALDHLSSGFSISLSQLQLVIASAGARQSTVLSKVLPAATKNVTGATGYPKLHSGFTDVSLDVSALAGETVTLSLGKLPLGQPRCGPLPSSDTGLLLDHIRVK